MWFQSKNSALKIIGIFLIVFHWIILDLKTNFNHWILSKTLIFTLLTLFFKNVPNFWLLCHLFIVMYRDHSYITSSHFWDFGTPLPPYVSMFLVLRISKNWPFLNPLPPCKCWCNIWIVPKHTVTAAWFSSFDHDCAQTSPLIKRPNLDTQSWFIRNKFEKRKKNSIHSPVGLHFMYEFFLHWIPVL